MNSTNDEETSESTPALTLSCSRARERLSEGHPEIRILLLRHFTPTPGYPEDQPLVIQEAEKEAHITASYLSQSIDPQGCIYLLGSGTRARHQKSQSMLSSALQELGIAHTSIDLQRDSLRNVSFDLLPEPLRNRQIIQNWHELQDLPEGVESWDDVRERLSQFIYGIAAYLIEKRRTEDSRGTATVVMFTSGEIILPYVRKQIQQSTAGQALLEQFPEALYHLDPGEGCELQVSGSNALLCFPATIEQGDRIVLRGKNDAVLSQDH